MKLKILLAFSLIASCALAQELPVNPQTRLVSIRDSVEIKDKSLQEIQQTITQWGHTLLDRDNLRAVYQLKNDKQTETVSINLPLGTVLTKNMGGNRYLTNGSLGYSMTKTSGLNKFSPVVSSGGVRFGFNYTVFRDKLVYEFTNLEYTHDGMHFGPYEDEKPPQDDLSSSLFSKMSKKEFRTVKEEFFDRLKILSGNFRVYVKNQLGVASYGNNHSPISYASYKKIMNGMTYDEVSKMLDGEGKELSNNSLQMNGKDVVQQVVVWYDLDKSKNITVTFIDGKVASKQQQNL